MLSEKFKAGDYVEVEYRVHDDGMPEGRKDGLILELVGAKADQSLVLFSNGAILKFHNSQLVLISESR